MQPMTRKRGLAAVALLIAGAGCTRITVAPSCPPQLAVGQSGPVRANAQQPGAVPTYLWEVIPPEAGTFTDPSALDTTFQALQVGEAVIRLTASDSLFQMIAECTTTVGTEAAGGVSVTVGPSPAVVGQSATVRCISTGTVAAVVRTIEQTAGEPVVLQVVAAGEATFTPTVEGSLTFQCTGEDAAGVLSAPAFATVQVNAAGGSGRPPRR